MMDLLKGSLLSRTPLTDVLLNNKREVDDFAGLKFELEKLAPKKEEATHSNSKKMILKVMVQNSTNKILFARAEEDFVNFLCVLLAVPLGAVECLLDNRTCLKAIDNLYGSIADNMDKHLVTPEMKNRLMKGNLPHGYISKNQTIPLTEESFNHTYTIGSRRKKKVQFSSVKFVKGGGKYIRGPTMYKVTDDLTVTPSCMASTVSDLKEHNIPLSDIQELELEIGSKEVI
ncbi:hypothetical protein MIMGU_mgv1a021630mg [Erythranthe guttata]|uniref:DUF674 domain-containing protein n=1 Tax=Erythranthe guttata TaxID=4155 RepID=A0A022R1A1_ERYGU|nr:hypothetical protein MIMGU_mgv1a021630mg [Erythranthe guttata]